MFKLFIEGGAGYMALLTLILVTLLLAAWKAPAWVKEIGRIAAVAGIFGTLLGLMFMAKDIAAIGSVSTDIILTGVSFTLIPTMYGLLIYIVSQLICIIQKPRI